MMMTKTIGDITITCNSDLSGDILVFNNSTNKTDTFTYELLRNYFLHPSKHPEKLLWVKTLFVGLVRSKIISAVEQMDDDEVLKFEIFLED